MDTEKDNADIDDNLQKEKLVDETNKDDIQNDTIEDLEQNTNVNILGVATID